MRDRVFGEAGRKRYRTGTHRTRAPEDTLAALVPHLRRYGITRVANVTGLDRVGVPVYVAVRPNARSLSVSQGKGLDAASAKVSAIMESLEAHHAEFHRCLCRIGTRAQMLDASRATGARSGVIDPLRLPRARASADLEHRAMVWTTGEDLVTGRAMWVPLEMVDLDFTLPHVFDGSLLLRSSNGLASGNTLAEAVLHGLIEVIERDATGLMNLRRPDEWARARLDLASVSDPGAAMLLERFERADIAVNVWDVTTDIGVPAFTAAIFDRTTDELLKPWPPALGSGAHLDPGVALCRALTEAAQSRLTAIAGSRDDIGRRDYDESQSAEVIEHHRSMSAERGARSFRAIRSRATDTVRGDLKEILRRLASRGLREVVAIDLSIDDLPVNVARVIVPGLEGFEPETSALGERGRALEGRREPGKGRRR
ncbi:MAG TPA: YcaO-like family protein [Vicinamibacterales bacterium]|nr:YcaO-like family protein [Vicinamibacterales bacterium]